MNIDDYANHYEDSLDLKWKVKILFTLQNFRTEVCEIIHVRTSCVIDYAYISYDIMSTLVLLMHNEDSGSVN